MNGFGLFLAAVLLVGILRQQSCDGGRWRSMVPALIGGVVILVVCLFAPMTWLMWITDGWRCVLIVWSLVGTVVAICALAGWLIAVGLGCE